MTCSISPKANHIAKRMSEEELLIVQDIYDKLHSHQLSGFALIRVMRYVCYDLNAYWRDYLKCRV